MRLQFMPLATLPLYYYNTEKQKHFLLAAAAVCRPLFLQCFVSAFFISMLQLIVGELGNELFKRFAGSALLFELCNPVGEKSCSRLCGKVLSWMRTYWILIGLRFFIIKNKYQ